MGSIIKYLDNEFYYSVKVNSFFDQTTLNITSGGDEDYVKAIFKLEENKVFESCSALYDGPNSNLTFLSNKRVKIQRWNKSLKKFETLNDSQEADKSCQDELIKGYEGYDIY